jgi:hypothetical protein
MLPSDNSSWHGIAWNHENNKYFPQTQEGQIYFQNNVTKLAEKNFLVRYFIDRLALVDGKSGIGKVYGYLRDGIPAGENSGYMMYTLHQRGGQIMHYFYEITGGLGAAYQSMNVDMPFDGIPFNELLTIQSVVNIQYELMNA